MKKFICRLKLFLKGNLFILKTVRYVKNLQGIRKRKKTLAYIAQNFSHIAKKYDDYHTPVNRKNACDDYPIWVCWLQGKGEMPTVVKMCYDTHLKNAGAHKVNLITFDNYMEFADIPEYILDKHRRGIIHNTQLSDIIRVCLLCQHGGLWIDATVFVSEKISDFGGAPFWTLRWNRGYPGIYAARDYHEALLYCRNPGNALACFLRDIFFEYWKNADRLIDYLFLSASIEFAYMNINSIRAMIETVPMNAQGAYDLYHYLNAEFDETKYKALCEEVRFHKLTYKENFKEQTSDGNLTFYGYLLREHGRVGAKD